MAIAALNAERGPRAPLACPKCAAVVATIALPTFPGNSRKLLNATLSLMLDANVDVNAINPAALTDAVELRCLACDPVPDTPESVAEKAARARLVLETAGAVVSRG